MTTPSILSAVLKQVVPHRSQKDKGQPKPDLVGCKAFYDDTTRQLIPLELREGVADLRPRVNVKLAACFILSEISLWAYYECAISEPFRRAF